MTDPITPPPELVQQWRRTAPHPINEREHYHYITFCAAQWGADQDLEACCDWLFENDYDVAPVCLRATRRPKPPSLKEQALHELVDVYDRDRIDDATYDTIRRALEALDD
jgi:hypothetical protein